MRAMKMRPSREIGDVAHRRLSRSPARRPYQGGSRFRRRVDVEAVVVAEVEVALGIEREARGLLQVDHRRLDSRGRVAVNNGEAVRAGRAREDVAVRVDRNVDRRERNRYDQDGLRVSLCSRGVGADLVFVAGSDVHRAIRGDPDPERVLWDVEDRVRCRREHAIDQRKPVQRARLCVGYVHV